MRSQRSCRMTVLAPAMLRHGGVGTVTLSDGAEFTKLGFCPPQSGEAGGTA